MIIVWFESLASAQDSGPPRRIEIVGYLPEYRLADFEPTAAEGLDELIFFSCRAKENGTLAPDRLDPAKIEKLDKIRAAAKCPVVLCVGGWGRSEGFAGIARTPETRTRFALACAEVCAEQKFGGIDIDWEHPADARQQQDYAALLVELKRILAPKKLRLSIAMAGWQRIPREGLDAVDRVNLMAYDNEGRHSTLDDMARDVGRLLEQGATGDKIRCGVPFYGRGITQRDRTPSYREIVAKHELAPNADEVDGVYFNGPETLKKKLAYAREKKLAGLMIWEIGQDAAGERSLLKQLTGERKQAPNR